LPECFNIIAPLLECAAAFLGRAGTDAIESVVVQIGFGQPGVTRTPALLAAVDVSPHGERIQRDISQLVGIGDVVSGEQNRQVVAVTPARLTAGTLDALPVVDRTRIIREVDHLHLGFLVHGGCPSFVVR
jgi:hypothetical protein